MNLVAVKSTLKDSSHGLGAKDTDLVEGLSGAKEREEVVGRGTSDQGWLDAVSNERRLGHMVLRLDSCCENWNIELHVHKYEIHDCTIVQLTTTCN